MKLNTEKWHLLMSRSKYGNFWAQIDNEKIWEYNEVKPLGITVEI